MPSIDEWIKKYGFVLNGILFGILLQYCWNICFIWNIIFKNKYFIINNKYL